MFSKSLFMLFLRALLVFILGCSISYAQDEGVLDKMANVVDIQAFDFSVAVQKLGQIYNVPVGFESSPSDKSVKQDIQLRKATLREALNFVVTKSNPSYAWSFDDGAVTVYPKNDRDIVLENILSVKIERIQTDKKSSKLQIRDQLVNLPEIGSELIKYDLRPLNLEFFESQPPVSANVGLCMSDTTFRRVLKEIATQSGSNFWIVSRYGKNREFFIVNF